MTIKERLRSWMLCLGLWLVARSGANPLQVGLGFVRSSGADPEILLLAKALYGEVSAVLPMAVAHCKTVDEKSAPGTSGEYRRHWVYSRLQKDFPHLPHRHLALAIELALGQIDTQPTKGS